MNAVGEKPEVAVIDSSSESGGEPEEEEEHGPEEDGPDEGEEDGSEEAGFEEDGSDEGEEHASEDGPEADPSPYLAPEQLMLEAEAPEAHVFQGQPHTP